MPYEGVKKNPFRQRLERTPEDARVIDRFREAQRAERNREHLASVVDLHEYLEKNGHAEACASAFSCDPWKYEPVVLDDLIAERSGQKNPDKINFLRGLIRAGSWMTYPRQTPADLRTRLKDIRAREESSWSWKIRDADPDTAKELKAYLTEVHAELTLVSRAIEEGRVGDDLEPATVLIEDLSGRLWLELKQLIAMHGLTERTMRKHHITRPLLEEIERIRPIRDLLYFRRLYPVQARRTITASTPAAR